MDYVIGIDSGGTNYRLKAADLSGKVLGCYTGLPASIYALDRESLVMRIEANVDALLATFGGRRGDCRYILCGTTGVDSDEDERQLMGIYNSLPGFTCPAKVINDAQLAHYTVTGGEGALVISGTGTIAYACDGEGNTARSGGWLFSIMGDEGSGAWVSRMALRQLGRHYDGAISRSVLIDLVEAELDLHSREDLNRLASRMGERPWGAPKLGSIVDRADHEGDPIAHSILEKAAGETFSVVKDAIETLQLDRKCRNFKLGMWGSNLLKSDTIRESFIALARSAYPECRILMPERESIDGALELALNGAKELDDGKLESIQDESRRA